MGRFADDEVDGAREDFVGPFVFTTLNGQSSVGMGASPFELWLSSISYNRIPAKGVLLPRYGRR
jgi:hypothetical protein